MQDKKRTFIYYETFIIIIIIINLGEMVVIKILF